MPSGVYRKIDFMEPSIRNTASTEGFQRSEHLKFRLSEQIPATYIYIPLFVEVLGRHGPIIQRQFKTQSESI
jgi:hypothetical protein